MIISNGNLCDDNGQPLSCPLQPVIPTMQPGGLQKKVVYIRQGCVVNCTHFMRSQQVGPDGNYVVTLFCCDRKILDVKIKNTEGN